MFSVDTAARLTSLPRLDRLNAAAAAMSCKICKSQAPFFDVMDFNKGVGEYEWGPSGVTVPWYRCRRCGFLFTPFCDDWSEDEFRRFIYNDDYALLDPDYRDARPRGMARRMANLLAGHRDARILDYGSGSGLFAELMGQAGFRDVVAYDPFSSPNPPAGRFDMVSCIEVIEHLPHPTRSMAEMVSLLRQDGAILLGETLQPRDIDRLRGSWWYCAVRNGHVSTFTDRGLVELARQHGLTFHRAQDGIHVLRRGIRFKHLADRLGPGLAAFQLGAPVQPGEGYRGLEGAPGTQFRWTTAETISWRILVPPEIARAQVMVPFVHQSRHTFASESTLAMDGVEAPVTVSESALFAEFDVPAPGPVIVTLRTPFLTPSRDEPVGIALSVLA